MKGSLTITGIGGTGSEFQRHHPVTVETLKKWNVVRAGRGRRGERRKRRNCKEDLTGGARGLRQIKEIQGTEEEKKSHVGDSVKVH